MYYRLALSAFLLGVLIYIVSRSINSDQLWFLIFRFPKKQLLILCLISSLVTVLKAWRFLTLLLTSDIEISFWEALRIYAAGGAITPIPGGEAVRGILIKKETGTKISYTVGPIISQAYLEIISAAILTLIGSLIFRVLRIPATIILILLLGLAFILSRQDIFNFIFEHLKKFKSLKKKLMPAQKHIEQLIFDEQKNLVKVFLVSIITHLIGGLLIVIISNAYNIEINFLESFFIYSASIIIQGLSISPGGIGFTEGGIIGLLLIFKVNFHQALAITLIFRAVTLFFYILVGILFLVIFYGKAIIFKRHFFEGAKS